MKKPKSLGQIAYEANKQRVEIYGAWAELPPGMKEFYSTVAAAVARAVRRRERGKK